ncbi:glutathione S-transferase family protein [Loktanella sp. F6476L]|uniref:glutathione S-transferase family protein n=1 Tax=Loktanella sp. F6476L TaxID=2926405 RepID=UPI001FF14046|nr:glutathione S-transferase family protein [Loktanella sp. F6476L]MCK0120883.1 glutathione S-transferase family protein [Loktanella sp. F6476L]
MIRLHHCHQTRSMRSLWLLHELGVPFELQVYPFDASIKSEAYLALNPAGRVPSLEIDGQVLFESGAIAEVLCEYAPVAGLGRLAGDPERYAWLNWIHFAETISQHCAALTQQHVALFEDHMRSPIVMNLEARRLAKTIGTVETGLTKSGYLLDSGFSAADISVGQAIYMATHFVPLDAFPKVTAWYDRLTTREAFQKALPPQNEPALYAKDFYPPWPVEK